MTRQTGDIALKQLQCTACLLPCSCSGGMFLCCIIAHPIPQPKPNVLSVLCPLAVTMKHCTLLLVRFTWPQISTCLLGAVQTCMPCLTLMPSLICRMSHVTHATIHTSHVTCHTPHATSLTLMPSRAGGLHHSLLIAHSLSQPHVQHTLSLHNISAAARSQRVRNAAVSIAYNAAVRVLWRQRSLHVCLCCCR